MFSYWNVKKLDYRGSLYDLLVDDTTCIIHISMYGETFILEEGFISEVYKKVNEIFPLWTVANSRIFIYSGDYILEWRLGFLRVLPESDLSLTMASYIRA